MPSISIQQSVKARIIIIIIIKKNVAFFRFFPPLTRSEILKIRCYFNSFYFSNKNCCRFTKIMFIGTMDLLSNDDFCDDGFLNLL